ncbi:uncharacterized protein LOC134190192 [Corticium candelabrum]|uniref:uncharacterized protein LOC134190192 n=1 Tax=Corticium candelabrum TaxID=121492 RepID=UPI002E258A70|nr:uncharacterized protein LOC134190192 [Corticium candelabrum]
MSSGGGGWTLVGRACGETTEWSPKSTNWYNSALINPDTAENIRELRSMKNRGWLSIPGRKVKVCFKGPHTSCAVFTHNLGIPLSRLFASKFGVTVTENYNFQKLRSAFRIPPNLTYRANHQWCGLNVADGCNHATNPNVGARHTICRIGCIGDYSGKSQCRLDDFALGIGVSSCYDSHGCSGTGTSTKNLHYRDARQHGFFKQTAFIYVQ